MNDGISGAEFANRPGFLRLMNALKSWPPFQVLVMSEESRLGREAIETAYALKQLVTGGVRAFFYLEARERTLDSPTQTFMMSVTAFTDALERDKARIRVTDAMPRKARAGYCCGGRVFGYDNVEVPWPSGKRSHVVNRINPAEAAVVRQIFELAAMGHGVKTIAKALNARGLPAQRPQRQRPRGWAPSSVYEILRRDLYRGVRVWNKSKKRDAWGKKQQRDRPLTEWLIIPVEDLRIVSDDLWNAVQTRARARVVIVADYRQGRRADVQDGRGVRSHYFLTGFGECATCGGSMQVVSRASKTGRNFRYICGTYWNRGASICPNGRRVEMSVADAALRELLKAEVLRPSVIEPALERALELLQTDKDDQARRPAVERALAAVDTQLANLVETAASGGAVPAVLQDLAQHDQKRRRLTAELGRLDVGPTRNDQADELRALMRALLDDWDALLSGDMAEARPILDQVLAGRITLPRGCGRYQLTVPVAFDRVFSTVIPELSLLQDSYGVPNGIRTPPVHSLTNNPDRCPSPLSRQRFLAASGVNVTRPFSSEEIIGLACVGSSARTVRHDDPGSRSSSRTRALSRALRPACEAIASRSARGGLPRGAQAL